MCTSKDKCSCLDKLRSDIVALSSTVVKELRSPTLVADAKLVRAGSMQAYTQVIKIIDKLFDKESVGLLTATLK